MATGDVWLTPSGHLITECGREKRHDGLNVAGVEFCPVDSGARRRYSSYFVADRLVAVTDKVVRVSCLGCRLGVRGDARLVELVARSHGPLVPSHGV